MDPTSTSRWILLQIWRNLVLEPQLCCPEGVAYNDALHAYTLDGVPAPSVSEVLQLVNPDQYAMVSAEILERASKRGRAGHEMIALDTRNMLDIYELEDELLVSQYLAWDKIRHDLQIEVLYSERVVCSRRHKFCGTLDLIASLVYKGKRELWLLDAKFTAQLPPLVGVQVAAYSVAAEECLPAGHVPKRRGCIWIKNGTAKLVEMPNPADRAVFIAGRTLLNWREKNV